MFDEKNWKICLRFCRVLWYNIVGKLPHAVFHLPDYVPASGIRKPVRKKKNQKKEVLQTMHLHPRKAVAVLTACLTLLTATPAAAETVSGLQDRNGDGVVDIFDYVIAKRASVDDNSPSSINLSSAEGAPGETVSLDVSINDNAGITAAMIVLEYPDPIAVADLGEEEAVQLNKEQFGDLKPSYVMFPEANSVVFTTTRRVMNSENGTMFSVSFSIPQDAEPGTVYQISVSNPELHGENHQLLPLLTGRGKITVTQPAETTASTEVTTAPILIAPPVTATTAVSLTTAAETTTQTSLTTAASTTSPTTTTTTTTTMEPYLYHGIDISGWQDGADFNQIAQDPQVDFVILRAGFGKYLKQKDPCFEAFYKGAKEHGIPVGAYWYSYAMTPEEARLEADICAQVLAGKQFEFPIAFDIEEPKQLNLPMDQVSAIIDAFCYEMEQKGYYAQIYCSSFYLNNVVNDYAKSRYDVWCAHYNVSRPTFTGKYGMWQYSHTGRVKGIKGDVDLDYCYRDYPEIIKRYHFNGF